MRREIADVESVQDCGVACNIGNEQFCNALHYDKTTRICHMFNVNIIGMTPLHAAAGRESVSMY